MFVYEGTGNYDLDDRVVEGIRYKKIWCYHW